MNILLLILVSSIPLLSHAQTCNPSFCNQGAPFCDCGVAATCPFGIQSGALQSTTRSRAWQERRSCGTGQQVQFQIEVTAVDATAGFNLFSMSDSDKALYDAGSTFSFLTSFSTQGSSCFNSVSGLTGLQAVNIAIESTAACGLTCPTSNYAWKITSSCVGSTTTSSTSSTTTAATTTPASSCCSTCANNPPGFSFACPRLNGVSGCQIVQTNGVTSCTCSANSQSCASSLTTCSAACPTTTTTTTTTTAPASSSASCFHKETIITYGAANYTHDQLRVHPECSIPHVVQAVGVVVSASCASRKHERTVLRLTDGHLIYTQRGLQAAADLNPGMDIVYADLEQKIACDVLSVTKETELHEYFGLNCLNSQVLASGLKASTFEKLHSVPAFWMHVMGRILGIKRASAIGDYVAELVQKMSLI